VNVIGGKTHSPSTLESGDQLAVIFDVLGTPPNAEDLMFITDHEKLAYIKKFPKREGKDLKLIYPGSGADALDLLQKLLAFDPFQRMTAQEALSHTFFDSIKDRSNEMRGKPLTVDIDLLEEQELTMVKLKAMFVGLIEN